MGHSSADKNARVRPAKFAHVVFRTRQMNAMVQWWLGVLEAEVVFENPFIAVMTYVERFRSGAPVAELVQQGAA